MKGSHTLTSFLALLTHQFLVNAMVLDEDKAHLREGMVELLHLRASGEVISGEQTSKINNRNAIT